MNVAPSETGAQRIDARFANALGAIFTVDALAAFVILGYGASYLLQTLHSPPSYPAIAISLYGLVKLVTSPVGGWLSDRLPSFVLVSAVGALLVGGLLVILLSASAVGYLVGVAILSAGIALQWLLVFRTLGDLTAQRGRGSATAIAALVGAAAALVGAGAAGVISERGEPRVAFALAIVLAVSSTVCIWFARPLQAPAATVPAPPEADVAATTMTADVAAATGSRDVAAATGSRDVAAATGSRDVAAATGGEPVVSANRVQLVGAIVAFAHLSVLSAVPGVIGPLALRQLDLTLLRAELLLAPAALAGVLAVILAGRRSRTGARLQELTMLYALGAVALLLLAPVGSPLWFALAMIPVAVAIGGVDPLLNASLLDVAGVAKRQGSALGRLLFVEGIGSAAGPAALGVVIGVLGIRAGVIALALGFVVLTVLAGVASRLVRL